MAAAVSEVIDENNLIENGDISLPPYEYGFIGGASGKDGKRLFFIYRSFLFSFCLFSAKHSSMTLLQSSFGIRLNLNSFK